MNQNLLLTATIFLIFSNVNFAQNNNYTLVQLDSLLEKFKAERAYDKLLPYAQIGVQKAEKEFGTKDTTYAKMLYFLGFGCQMQQRYEEAKTYLNQAIEIQSKKIPQHKDYASTLHNLAFLYHSLGNYEEAKPLYDKAMKIRKNVLGITHPDYAKSLNNLAGLYWGAGDYEKAEPLYKDAIEIRRVSIGTNNLDYLGSLNNLAVLYVELGRYLEAETLYKQVLAGKKALVGEQSLDYGVGLHNIGILYEKMGRYEEAEHLYKEALIIERKNQNTHTPSYVDNLITLSSYYLSTQNLEMADSFCREAIVLSKAILGEQHPSYIKNLSNWALIYFEKRDYDNSEALYHQVLPLAKATFGEQHKTYAKVLNNLGFLYMTTQNYEKAEALYKESMSVFANVLNGKTEQHMTNLNNLGKLYKIQEKYEESLETILRAIFLNTNIEISKEITEEVANKIRDVDYISLEQILASLHNYYILLEHDNTISSQTTKSQKQTIISNLVLQILEKTRNGFVGEADKLRNLELNSQWVDLSLRAFDKNNNLERAFDIAEQGKSVLLLDALKTNNAYAFGDLPDSLVRQERLLQNKYKQFQAALIEVSTVVEKEQLSIELNKLNEQIQNFKKQVENNYPQYIALKYRNKSAKIKEVQASLPPKTALLEYVLGDSVVYMFYVDKNNLRLSEVVISQKELLSKIELLHYTLSDYKFINQKEKLAYKHYTDNAHWFYQKLIAPNLEKASDIEHLIIIPDGQLGYLPFETFLVEQAPQSSLGYSNLHYLMNDYSISYNYSATLFIESKKKSERMNAQFKKGELLAMGASYYPTTGDDKLSVFERVRKKLEPLPAAKKEVELLEKHFQGFFSFDSTSSEKIFKEKAENYAIIHLAMHGLLDNRAPILSGLAFTETGDSVENDLLQAYEISKMRLNADLIVLSACETGYGKFEKGNGIASLAQAFAYAGAPAMIVSLWQVNDYSTAEIMKRLYQNLANGMAKDVALQQAKLEYLKIAKGIIAHPAFWSPFILIGNEDPVYIKTKNNWTWWLVGIGVLLSLVIGRYIVIKKHKKTSEQL